MSKVNRDNADRGEDTEEVHYKVQRDGNAHYLQCGPFREHRTNLVVSLTLRV